MKRKIAVLLLVLALTGFCLTAGAETSLLSGLLRSIDYGNGVTYVIGHKSPDADAIVKTAIENKQNLIIEGCYIPFDWRRDFDERYLSSIRFICLAMSENYIENHFGEIIGYESEIEARMIDTDCTKDSLKADNKSIIDGFQHAGEQIVLIDSSYEQTIKTLLT